MLGKGSDEREFGDIKLDKSEMGIGIGVTPTGDLFMDIDLPKDVRKNGRLSFVGAEVERFVHSISDGVEQVKREHNIP